MSANRYLWPWLAGLEENCLFWQEKKVMRILLKNGIIINRGRQTHGDILIKDERIERVDAQIDQPAKIEIDCKGKWIIPGLIDDQVHFREPGLTQKASIYTESRAAVAGGVTSFMEMPNTKPASLTQEILAEKYAIAKAFSHANYSFYMGASNDNIEEVLKTDPTQVCGIKVFMGSSTGNMLVDDMITLESIFSRSGMLIATHCEDEETIRNNTAAALEKYGKHIPPSQHPVIRSREACYRSSSLAVELAKKHGARLHILHITTEEELALFEPGDLKNKKITAEACVHHMFFNDQDYLTLGNKIKCNPAIKKETDRLAIIQAIKDDRIDVIATDHAPHTTEEKAGDYQQSPSGLPLVQHSLNILLDLHLRGYFTMEEIVRKACHSVADCFGIMDRGYLDEGAYADLVIIDPDRRTTVTKESLHYKCGWSPLEGRGFQGAIDFTFVNGRIACDHGLVMAPGSGRRLQFSGGKN